MPNILSMAIMEMIRMRKGDSFGPEEVVKWIYPSSWRYFMDEVLAQMMLLYREGKISVSLNGKLISMHELPEEKVKIGPAF